MIKVKDAYLLQKIDNIQVWERNLAYIENNFLVAGVDSGFLRCRCLGGNIAILL